MRKAKPEDASRLSELYTQLVNNPAVKVEPEQIQALYDNARSKLFVCDYQANVVGSALVSLCSDVMFRKQPFAVVENVIVDASNDLQKRLCNARLATNFWRLWRALGAKAEWSSY